MRVALSCLITVLVLAGPMPARAAGSPSIADRTYDAVLLRPLAAISCAVGVILFHPTALVTAPTGRDGLEQAYEVLIEPQWKELADRPLGEF